MNPPASASELGVSGATTPALLGVLRDLQVPWLACLVTWLLGCGRSGSHLHCLAADPWIVALLSTLPLHHCFSATRVIIAVSVSTPE